jgi:hypothetical protein
MPVPEMIALFRLDIFVAFVNLLSVNGATATAGEYQHGKCGYYGESVFHT